jgi:hypothetical protein
VISPRLPRAQTPAVVLAVCLGALVGLAGLAGSAAAQTGNTVTVIDVPAPPPSGATALTEGRALEIAQGNPDAQDWVEDRTISRTVAEHDPAKDQWTVWFMSESDGEETVEAQVFIADDTGSIDEVRTGPQVPWSMARGYDGAFGRAFTEPEIFLPLCALFLLPLLTLRRLISIRTLDLLVLLSFGVSLVWFNRGEIFTSVPLAYPPMVYLAARLVWIGLRRRPGDGAGAAADEPPPAEAPAAQARQRPGFAGWCPTWLLVTLLVVTLALRYGLNAFDSNVIDVGYAGVIGADRIISGATPYGTFPDDCASCDTYGPLNYIVYVPFTHFLGWSGHWDDLPAAHGAATLFDVLAVGGMLVLGWMLAGPRLGAALALAWAAFPFSGYALESNSNDTLVSALLVWGLVLAARPLGRGLFLGLAALSKFTPVILLPLWSRHPFPRRSPGPRGVLLFAAGLAAAAVLTGWVLLLDGAAGITTFWDRTAGYQIGRDSPFSVWGQHPGLRPLQIAVIVLVLLGAAALVRWPRRLDLVSLTALSGAVMIGLQLTMTHWFYLYIPWFLPFALLAMVPEWPPPSGRAGAGAPRTPARESRSAPVTA